MKKLRSDSYFSKTLEKGLMILSQFDRYHTQHTLSEISRLTGINKTSTYRLLNTLLELGYLKKGDHNKLLKLGPKALLLGHNFSQGFYLLQAIKPIIDRNFTEYGITIDSALLDSPTLISLYRLEAPDIIHFHLPLVMLDLHARAMGKAVLAQFSENELSQYLKASHLNKHTPKTITNREDLLTDLELTRSRGYSFNDEEYVTGLICMGAPLVNYQTNTVVGAISYDFPASEQSLETIEKNYTGILTKLAGEISEMITSAEN